MIQEIVPAGVAFAEAFDDHEAPDWYAEEAALVSRAVEKRRLEFGTVRRCARTALSGLGIPPVPLLPGPRGEPQWPAGIVGSMTHCARYRGAVVARDTEFLTAGIDAEPNGPLAEGVLAAIALPDERARVAELTEADPGICWDRLLFSAKEAVYKAWYPLARRPLEFEDARISVSPRGRTFHARLLVPGALVNGQRVDEFTGRWIVKDGIVLTAITPPAYGRTMTDGLVGNNKRPAYFSAERGVVDKRADLTPRKQGNPPMWRR